ncbi:MAG: hypothetical protein GY771_15155 [bacterium]|nr:hypothetical protein [bacterium]
MKRRDFIKKAGTVAATASALSAFPSVLAGCGSSLKADLSQKVIVLGIDGMDPALLKRFIASGHMPAFTKFLEKGQLHRLGTSLPPQSPVAWSNFISGAHPGVHGIYDFIARDPKTLGPYMSLARTIPAKHTIPVGDMVIPIDSPKTEALRDGPCFWVNLEDAGVDCTVLKIPSNFPVTPTSAKTMSDMGTPDMQGGYGTFSYYTDNPPEGYEDFTGGTVHKVRAFGNIISTKVYGPANSFRRDNRPASVDMTVYPDPNAKVAKIVIDGQEFVLKQGEWSQWVRVKFDLLGFAAGASGIFRMYLQQVHPDFALYLTPIQIDPENPAMAISTPNNYARKVSERLGTGGFYTQGFPEDTKTLSNDIFSDEEYMAQADLVLEERMAMFENEFARYKEGLFFFYFGSVDQNTHMLWRTMDTDHPQYDPNAPPDVKNGVRHYYEAMNRALEQVIARTDDKTTVMIMSDHGFAPFYKEFNVNSWLLDNGYLTLSDPELRDREYFEGVDWSLTQAYNVGLNSLYLNIKGREGDGVISQSSVQPLAEEIAAELETIVDPENGKSIFSKAYVANNEYKKEHPDRAPDIVLGFNRGYRISDGSALGEFPEQHLVLREDPWAADHCVDPATVPGTLMINREIGGKTPKLYDLAPTIMKVFGLEPDERMTGKPLIK